MPLAVPIPVGPPIVWGLLNVVAWAGFAWVTVAAKRPGRESVLAIAAVHL